MAAGGLTMPTAEELRLLQLRAKAEQERRQREGRWGGVRAHEEYQRRPEDWIVEKLGVPRETIRWSLNPEYRRHKWDGDVDPLSRMLESLAGGNDTGVESATGTGKTFLAACVTLWFLACFEDSWVITAAPKEDQLLLNIWKEIGGLFPKFQSHFPDAELLSGKIRMRPESDGREKWSAFAFVAGVGATEESATKAQGFHNRHMLIITEETPGMHPAIMEAFENTRTDDHNIQLSIGNPDNQHDTLHQFCMQEHVEHIRISALDHPNIVCGRSVVPGAIGPKRLARRIARLGEGTPLYLSRIRGISPAEAANALIKWDWCVQAAARSKDDRFREGLPALGVDVANSVNGDEAAIARWQGATLTEVESFACPDASLLGVRVAEEARDINNPVDPRHIGVDMIGVGAATVNKLHEEGLRIRALGSARRAVPGLDTDILWSSFEEDVLEGKVRPTGAQVIESEQFDNLRSQMWWRMREDLRLGRIALPDDEELFRDLTTPTYETKNGKIVVESKEDIVKRLKRSPNKGDAAVYGNFVRRRIPIRTVSKPSLENTRTRDRGLERLLYRRAQEQKRARQLEERALRRARRAKSRGRSY